MNDSAPTGMCGLDLDLLRFVAEEDVTWRNAGRGVSYRLWSSEFDYTTVPRYARLERAGLICRAPSYRTTAGPVALTAEGRKALRAEPQQRGEGEA